MSIAQKFESAEFETLELSVTDEILTIAISRPKALNALSSTVIAELREVIGAIRDELGSPESGSDDSDESNRSLDWSIRGVIFTGAGEKAFVAGADIAAMNKMSPAESETFTREGQELTSWIETLRVPVVAAVNGFALGGGCELALACDLIFATESASFGQPEVQLGLIPGFGGTVRLQQAVGAQIARDLIFSGRRIDAAEAHRIGLASRVFSSTAELLDAAHEFLRATAKHSPVAIASAKRTVRAVAPLSTDDGLAVELDAFTECFQTDDMREGTGAFLEKRSPNFSGS